MLLPVGVAVITSSMASVAPSQYPLSVIVLSRNPFVYVLTALPNTLVSDISRLMLCSMLFRNALHSVVLMNVLVPLPCVKLIATSSLP
jgi:hypothetical protein